jgi:uncharacterized protein
MHYLIDGYNMLFRLLQDGEEELQGKRESFIYDLNKKISIIKLNVSIVFDSAFQMGERSRSHYAALEILYSAEGETADDYILDELKNTLHPENETVVTSDKKLAWKVRNRSAHTVSVEEFILWLNRSYKKKLRQFKKEIQLPSSTLSPPLFTPSHSHEPPLDAYVDDYAQIFESKWQDMLKEEEQKKQKSSSDDSNRSRRAPRKPRHRRDPFEVPPSHEQQEGTEMERWLKAFEKRLLDSDSSSDL